MAQSHTPCSSCVRFVAVVAFGSRNTRLQAARYALPGLDLHQRIAPASWRLPQPIRRAYTIYPHLGNIALDGAARRL